MPENQIPPATPPDDPPPERHSRTASVWSALSWVRDLAFSVLIAVILIVFIYQPVKVEGTSMMPTLTDQERIFINKFTYHFGLGNIERGDMVVFWFPLDPSKVVHQARDRRTRRYHFDRRRAGLSSTDRRWSRTTSPTNIATVSATNSTASPRTSTSCWATTAVPPATAAPGASFAARPSTAKRSSSTGLSKRSAVCASSLRSLVAIANGPRNWPPMNADER